MKKLIGIVLAALLALCILPVSALADGEEVRYSIDGGVSWEEDSLLNALWATYGQKSVKIELLRDVTLDSSWYAQQDLLYGEDVVFELDGKGYTIYRGTCDSMLFCVRGEGSVATLKNVTIDGGAVWSSDDPMTRTNTGADPYYGNANLIYVDGGATLILDSGAILQNNDLGVEENNANYGAAVAVGYSDQGYGKLIMKEGSVIRNNRSYSGGGVIVYSSRDVFEMLGGEISNNTAVGGGGGVHTVGSFIMKGGSITGNASGNNGGGVCVNGSFTMEGGSIRSNRSAAGGGGITALTGSVTLKGGSVSGNSITGTMGGGVLVHNGSLTVSGAPAVSGNTAGGSANNIYLNSGKVINVDSSLAANASLGVTAKAVPAENAPVNVTGSNSADYKDRFASDNPYYSVVNSASNVVQLAYAEVYSISCADTENGSISATPSSAAAGHTIALDIIADSGYKVKSVTVSDANGNAIPVANGSFTMPAANVTVSAVFEKISIPSTGDDANIALWFGLAGISAIALVIFSCKAGKHCR